MQTSTVHGAFVQVTVSKSASADRLLACRSKYTTQLALDECYMQIALDLGLDVLSKHPIEARACYQLHFYFGQGEL